MVDAFLQQAGKTTCCSNPYYDKGVSFQGWDSGGRGHTGTVLCTGRTRRLLSLRTQYAAMEPPLASHRVVNKPPLLLLQDSQVDSLCTTACKPTGTVVARGRACANPMYRPNDKVRMHAGAGVTPTMGWCFEILVPALSACALQR